MGGTRTAMLQLQSDGSEILCAIRASTQNLRIPNFDDQNMPYRLRSYDEKMSVPLHWIKSWYVLTSSSQMYTGQIIAAFL